MKSVRVGIIDDHPLYRAGIVATINETGALSVSGEGGSGAAALALPEVDVILLDWHIPDGGPDLVIKLRQGRPQVRILALTADDSMETVTAALSTGANGYITKSSSGLELVSTIQRVAAGEAYIAPDLAGRLLSKISRPAKLADDGLDDLSARELDILKRVSGGQTNKEVARDLAISENTVKQFMTTIMRKLNVRNRVEASAVVLKQGQADSA